MSDLAERLAALEAKGLRRHLRPPEGVDLTGNDTLGLSSHPALRDALRGALDAGLPHGGTGSRLLSGNHPAWEATEARFAAWQGREAALYFATGYAANVGLLSTLPRAGEVVVSDALNHASIIDGLRLGRAERRVVPHLDLDAIDRALPTEGQGWVVVESVWSMEGELTPLAALAELCADRGARLIVDEAHATGLFGPEGQGLVAALGLQERVFASVHTCGKALGLAGAFVCGGAALRELLLNEARSFVFSTAAPPLYAPVLDAAVDLVRADAALRDRPLALAERLRSRLAGRVSTGRSASAIVPLVVGAPEAALSLGAALAARGWDARAIRPPTVPEGTSRVRVVLHANLTEAQVDALADDILAALT